MNPQKGTTLGPMGNYSLLVHIKPRRIFILVFDYGSKGGIAKALTPPLYYRTLGAFTIGL